MRVTIFGATGLLGKALVRDWPQDRDQLTLLGSEEADLRDAAAVSKAIESSRPDWVILSAAYTDVDGCETNRDLAMDVNYRGALNVGRAAKQQNVRLLFLSSDYVFDGAKLSPYQTDDVRAPRSVYGRSKADAEVELLKLLPNCCVLRTSWLFGAGGKCFPETILKLAATRPSLDVVDDQRGSPTYTNDLAAAIVRLCHAGASGIVHATNGGDCSWFDFAQEIVSRAGLKTEVRPTTSDKFVRPAERPKYSVLSPASLNQWHITMPPWQDALHRYFKERGNLIENAPQIPPNKSGAASN